MENGPNMIIYDIRDRVVRENVFEELGVWIVGRALKHASIVVLDELGRFEVDCYNFINSVKIAFDSNITLLVSVKDEKNPFLGSLLNRSDIKLFKIDYNNRDDIFNSVILMLNSIIS